METKEQQDYNYWEGRVKQDGYALQFVPESLRTEKLCKMAVNSKTRKCDL